MVAIEWFTVWSQLVIALPAVLLRIFSELWAAPPFGTKPALLYSLAGFFVFVAVWSAFGRVLDSLQEMTQHNHPRAADLYRPPSIIREKNGRMRIRFFVLNLDTGNMEEKRRDFGLNQLPVDQRETEAKKQLALIDQQCRRGIAYSPKQKAANNAKVEGPIPKRNVREALEYALQIKLASVGDRARYDYRQRIGAFLEMCRARQWDRLLINDLQQWHVLQYLDDLVLQGRSNATYNNYLRTLKAVTNVLVERGELSVSPVTGLKELRTKSATHKTYTEQERAIFEPYLQRQEPELYDITRLVYFCFIRRSELMRLTVGDVRLSDRRILIAGEQSKSGRTDTVELPNPVLQLLERWHLDKYPFHYALIGPELKPAEKPGPLNLLSKRHRKALEAANIYRKGLTFYSWKHTGAAYFFRKYGNLYELSQQMRHTSIAQTEQYLNGLGVAMPSTIAEKEW